MDISQTDSQTDAQSEFLEKMRRQFDFGPYPRTPIEESPTDNSNELFIHNLLTPYYLHHHKFINTEGKVLLDAGCGTGYKALILATANPGARVVGIDISPKSIELAEQRLEYHGFKDKVEFHVLAIEEVAKLEMKFDYINCDEVLYFFDDIANGLAALKSVLKPQGIIRSNLHSLLQRQIFFRAQELFGLMGLMEEFSEEMAIPIVVETMKALGSWVDIKKYGWNPAYEVEEKNMEALLANHLLQGDKGYRVTELFEGLKRAGLEFVAMTNWRQWDVADLFNEPDNLPSYLAMGLADSSQETRLTLYELMNPVHRLLDFWCANSLDIPDYLPIPDWSLQDWQTSQVALHPQLKTDKFKQAAIEAINQNKPLMISEFLSLPALKPVTVDASVVNLLLKLWDAPQSFEALADLWQHTHPVNWVTLEPISRDEARQKVADALGKLEVFLYVLVERGH
ncbi:class I SAM-dependent methyltransferase [Leptolyngbya sp. PCC 6406]|uniref:class I SAM-dependent methyltransferase n=1 Tax=Leptolyngbya sp. PCC 6406 TaxID=1173264 RepID=UPI0002AC1BE3|nr:class I SAM-dependent methyltransferase [Leptolyngbya sp. PCC 6406]